MEKSMDSVVYIIDRIIGMFEDENGGLSTTRVAFMFVIVVTVSIWAITCLRQNSMLPMNPQDTILPIVFAGLKWQQKKDEIKEHVELEKIREK